MKLVVIQGAQTTREWPLQDNPPVVLGRGAHGDSSLVDLSPDRYVSRVHARIWQEAGQWWIEDLGSLNGTRVCGRDISKAGPVPIEPGLPLNVGRTTLMLVSEDWHRVRIEQVTIEFEINRVVGFSLAHCGIGPVTGIVARNDSEDVTREVRLGFAVPGFGSSQSVHIPSLAPGQVEVLGTPGFHWAFPALESQVEATRNHLHISANGRALPGEQLEIMLLAHNEWSSIPGHRDSLAAFVLPNHPVIARIAHRVRQNPGHGVLAAVYEVLATQYHLVYTGDAPSFERESQKIRLPHQVIPDPGGNRGEGTCIDLALLVAGCLENLGSRPAVLLVDVGDCWHALVGARDGEGAGQSTGSGRRRAGCQHEGCLIDPTGFTLHDGNKAPFSEAQERAAALAAERAVVFTLDVALCRERGIRPLPFAGEPRLSDRVSLAVDLAKQIAEKNNRERTGASHLLLAMLNLEDGVAARVFAHLGVQPEGIIAPGKHPAENGEDTATPRPSPSYHFDMALAGARELAKRCGSPMVEEEHLLVSLMELRSNAVTAVLSAIGSSREEVIAAVSDLLPERRGGAHDWLAGSDQGGSAGLGPRSRAVVRE